MNQENLYYDMLFKRKSFHVFRDIGTISEKELTDIECIYETLQPLHKEIQTAIRIIPARETTCKRGQEYCILMYSEKKEGYRQNIGYIGEQLDLYLASCDIGALWFGIGKVEEPQYRGMDFVIMIAIAKMPREKFRKDMFKSKRKPLEEVWLLTDHTDIGNVARFAPSACNTQPWLVESEQDPEGKQTLVVYRYKKPGKRGIMPAYKVAYYNRIDIGIFLLFLEVCLKQQEINYERALYEDEQDDEAEKTLVARYCLNP